MKEDDYLPWAGEYPIDLETIYQWTYEDAVKAQKEWAESQEEPPILEYLDETKEEYFQSWPDSIINRWKEAQYLRELGETYDKNKDNGVIIEALFICNFFNFSIPYWLQRAYIGAYLDIINKAKTSWDDVFGKPHSKWTRANDERKKLLDAMKVYNRIQELRAEGNPIDGNLFARVGLELAVGGKTKTAELYYWRKKEELESKNKINK